jgi:hypothetical protein
MEFCTSARECKRVCVSVLAFAVFIVLISRIKVTLGITLLVCPRYLCKLVSMTKCKGVIK